MKYKYKPKETALKENETIVGEHIDHKGKKYDIVTEKSQANIIIDLLKDILEELKKQKW